MIQFGNSATEGEGVRELGGEGVLSFRGGRVGNVGCSVGVAEGIELGLIAGVGEGLVIVGLPIKKEKVSDLS